MAGSKIPRYLLIVLAFGAAVAVIMLSMFTVQYRWLANEIVTTSETEHEAFLEASFERRVRAQLHAIADELAVTLDTANSSAQTAALEAALVTLSAGDPDAMGDLVDVRNENAVLAAYDNCESRLGPISIVVNNAAARPYESLTAMSREQWSDVIDVILTAPFITARELFRRLPAERNGAIVNIGGISAHLPAKDRVHVIAAKAGLVGLTRALAEEGSGRIRANCVVPGAIETARQPGQRPARFMTQQDRRTGTPEDVARAVLPLADPSMPYTTGQTIHVSGGRYMP